jgi:hypothetical protein
MRNLIIMILVIFSLPGYSQLGKGKVISLDADTVKGADTIYIAFPKLTGFYSTFQVEASFNQVGGTSDGEAYMQSSIDSNWTTWIEDENWLVDTYPTDTVTITNGGYGRWMIIGVPDIFHRLVVTGTSGDTTEIEAKYLLK